MLFRRQLAAMQAQEPGIRADQDPECLHDFRVAIRRTRSLLVLSRRVLGRKSARRFRDRFGRLGRDSGRRRDFDVQLADLAVLTAANPADDWRALKPIEAWLRRHRNLAHFNLKRLLAGARYRALLREWSLFLDSLNDPGYGTEAIVRDLAQEAIRGAWRRVCREGTAINERSPPAEFHELRKSAKRLRYALEFFEPVLETKSARAVIRDLKRMQDDLGAYQDCRVQMGVLQEAEMGLLAGNRLAADTALALSRVRSVLLHKERELRRHFREHFDRFPCAQIGNRLKAMLENSDFATGNA